MPNWCSNKLNVAGPGEELGSFLFICSMRHMLDSQSSQQGQAVGGAGYLVQEAYPLGWLSFEGHVPVPEGVVNKGLWYDWSIQNWGTKWNCNSGACIEEEELKQQRSQGYLEFHFDTAWSPPEPWLENVAARHPELSFTLCWEEPGCGYGGRLHFAKGELHDEQEHKLEYPDVVS